LPVCGQMFVDFEVVRERVRKDRKVGFEGQRRDENEYKLTKLVGCSEGNTLKMRQEQRIDKF